MDFLEFPSDSPRNIRSSRLILSQRAIRVRGMTSAHLQVGPEAVLPVRCSNQQRFSRIDRDTSACTQAPADPSECTLYAIPVFWTLGARGGREIGRAGL